MCAWITIVDLDECAKGQHNCHQHAVCANGIGSFTCHCQSGYTGDGFFCEGISFTGSIPYTAAYFTWYLMEFANGSTWTMF